MSNEDAPHAQNTSLTDGSRKYDKVLEDFARDKREAILANIEIISRSQRKEAMTAIVAGKALLDIKKVCQGKREKFREICEKAEVTTRMIQYEMRVAKRFYDVRDLVCDIPLNLLIRLAARATSGELVEWVIQEKRAGRPIDLAELKSKLGATSKKKPSERAVREHAMEGTAEAIPASITDAEICLPPAQTNQVGDEPADAGVATSAPTADPTVADESSGRTSGSSTGDERQPVKGQVLRLAEWTRVGPQDERATAAYNAADMLMNNGPVDRHELAAQLVAADANELKKLLIERCSTAEAAE
ncbi:hypothetical protein AU375_03365 [Methylobacterium radiotolerans]|nr:hypothetical protein AU375_03365 [Methylobacterium radiotolerans]